MKYRCSHCNHQFELKPGDYARCPQCFWTTSLIPVEPAATPVEAVSRQVEIQKPKQAQAPVKLKIQKPLVFFLFLIAGASAITFLFMRGNLSKSKSIVLPKLEDIIKKDLSDKKAKKTRLPAPKTLRGEDLTALLAPFNINIPRTLTEDETSILKKRVQPPENWIRQPDIQMWTVEEFRDLLDAEQKKRGISFGWMYEHSLVKAFEKHYLAGGEALQAGKPEMARDEFLQALDWPIYENNPKLFRAVVLVMLRPFINDIIGKLAVLNQYFLSQAVKSDVEAVFKDYEALFAKLGAHSWDEADRAIAFIKERVDEIEKGKANAPISYPAGFTKLDQELQRAIHAEAEPKPDAVFEWKPLLLDLKFKDEVIKQNKRGVLEAAQAAFSKAVELARSGRLEEAESQFRSIRFPPELTAEAKKRAFLISKSQIAPSEAN